MDWADHKMSKVLQYMGFGHPPPPASYSATKCIESKTFCEFPSRELGSMESFGPYPSPCKAYSLLYVDGPS